MQESSLKGSLNGTQGYLNEVSVCEPQSSVASPEQVIPTWLRQEATGLKEPMHIRILAAGRSWSHS